MATLEEKIAAITNLMQQGVLTGEEFSKVVQVLSNPAGAVEAVEEKSPLEQKYDDCFKKHIINNYKSPASCKWPPLESSMIKEGTVSVLDGWSYKDKKLRYIETYLDAANSYGTMLRQEIRIVINSDGDPQMVLQKVKGTGLISSIAMANQDKWMPMSGVKL